MASSAQISSRLFTPCVQLLRPCFVVQKLSHPQIRAMGHGSHASDNDPDVLQKEQERNLKGETRSSIPHAPGWNEKLASDSEAAVKAEQDSSSIEELQKHTVDHLHSNADGGGSQPQVPISDVPTEKKGSHPV